MISFVSSLQKLYDHATFHKAHGFTIKESLWLLFFGILGLIIFPFALILVLLSGTLLFVAILLIVVLILIGVIGIILCPIGGVSLVLTLLAIALAIPAIIFLIVAGIFFLLACTLLYASLILIIHFFVGIGFIIKSCFNTND